MNKFIAILALLITSTAFSAPNLTNYDTFGFLGGKNFDAEYSNNISLQAWYQFEGMVIEEASELEFYVAIGETQNDTDFTLLEKINVADLAMDQIRLMYASQKVYFALNELNLNNINEFVDNKTMSVYSIVRDANGDETRTEYRTIQLGVSCCWFEEENLDVPTFDESQAVSFTLNATHVDEDQSLTYKVIANQDSEFPEGLVIDASTGNVTWNNPEVGEFGFTVKAVDNNNWYYEAKVTFSVDALQSVRAEDLNLQIYPNPTTEYVTLELKDATTATDLNVYNANGTVVNSKSVNGNQATINLVNQPAGTYYIEVNGVIYSVVKN